MSNSSLSVGQMILLIYASNTLRGGPKTATTSTMERFVVIVNGWKPLTIITKRSILDVKTALDPSLSQGPCQVKHPSYNLAMGSITKGFLF